MDLAPLGQVSSADRHRVRQIAIGDIIRRSARRQPHKICVIEGDRSITYLEMDQTANKIANYLLGSGLMPGDKVATLCANSIEYIQFIFGLHKAGLVWVPINIGLSSDEVSFIIDHSEAKLLLADTELLNRPNLACLVAERELAVLASRTSDGIHAAKDLRTVVADEAHSEPSLTVGHDELAMIMYTSGTTSRAKGVMHCHEAVITAVLNNNAELSVTRDDRVLVFLPMFHIAAHCLCMMFLAAGSSIVLQPKFDAGSSLTAIQEHDVTFLVGLPMMYEAMLDHPARATTDLTSLRVCNYAMAPMAKPLLERLIADFCPTFLLTSGQTEAYPHTVIFRPEEQLRRFGNYWGQCVMMNDVAIMDDDGTLLQDGQVGEIVYRGPNMMLGYFKDPEASIEVSKFGWHHTGDLGCFDEDGQLRFVDRKKDLIKSGGENVASVKVEEILLRHPSVDAAVVIGVPHPRWQEAILACVQLKPGAKVTEIDIIAHCRANLGLFEVPKAVEFVDEIPRTASMKTRKIELRDRFRTRFEGPAGVA